MATLTNVPTTRLAILDVLPDGFLSCRARDLHLLLDGPTLIELPGKAEPPLFVSILLHGNEDSGLGAVQRVLHRYLDEPLPRSLMLLVGNVEAARQGLRRLDGQPDYNRIWPGAPNDGKTVEARIIADVHARAVDRRVFGAIDVHNNTGRNPHYSVVCDLDPHTLGLAVLFARRAVCFRGIPGTSTASFAGLIPAVTAECGLPGHAANERAEQAKQAQTTVQAVLEAVPNAEAFEAGFESVFNDLPEHAQTAIRHELALLPNGPVRAASDADLVRFATTPEGAELVKTWGRDAGRKLATVRARIDRMLLSGGDMEAAVEWFDQLTSAEAKSVLTALAGGR